MKDSLESRLKRKTIAGDEPSSYDGSTIDNNSAFTQSQGRDAIQPIQKEQDEDVLEGDDDGDGDEAWTRSMESGEEASCSLPIREAEHLLAAAEIKFTIPKDRYEEVKTAMSNGSNCCYLIFDRNSGSFLRSESSEIGN